MTGEPDTTRSWPKALRAASDSGAPAIIGSIEPMSAAIVARERRISSQKPLTEKRRATSMAEPIWSEPMTCPTAAMWNSGIADQRTSPEWRSRFSRIWRAMFAT